MTSRPLWDRAEGSSDHAVAPRGRGKGPPPRQRLTLPARTGCIDGNDHKYGQLYQDLQVYDKDAMTTSDVKAGPTAGQYELSHLRSLEAEAIHIIREVAAEFERPVLLFSGGKDSIVMLHLALKAFRPGRLPFPVMHVDTGHNFDEVIATRDELVEESGVRLVVASVQEDIDAGRVVETIPSRNPIQTVTLLRAIRENKFDAAFGGARRDEEKARAKERVFSFRDEFGQWDPKAQRPGAVEPVQRSSPQGRAHPGLPAVELDRVRHLVLHRRREDQVALDLFRPPAQGV